MSGQRVRPTAVLRSQSPLCLQPGFAGATAAAPAAAARRAVLASWLIQPGQSASYRPSRSIRPALPLSLRLSLLDPVARDQHRIGPRIAGDVGGLDLALRFGSLVGHYGVVEEIAQRAGLDREIDVLGDVAGRSGDP